MPSAGIGRNLSNKGMFPVEGMNVAILSLVPNRERSSPHVLLSELFERYRKTSSEGRMR